MGCGSCDRLFSPACINLELPFSSLLSLLSLLIKKRCLDFSSVFVTLNYILLIIKYSPDFKAVSYILGLFLINLLVII
jgi:hypothetical protein